MLAVVIGYAPGLPRAESPCLERARSRRIQFLPQRQRELLTGVYQQDSSSKPPPAPLIFPRHAARHDERPRTRGSACLTIIQSYQQLDVLLRTL